MIAQLLNHIVALLIVAHPGSTITTVCPTETALNVRGDNACTPGEVYRADE